MWLRFARETARSWNAAGGGAEVLRVAVPLILSTLSWTIMNLIDRIFLAWYSPDAVAAAAPAALLMFVFMCLPMGIAGYANTFVAQYYGAGQKERIGAIVWTGLWVGLISTPFLMLSARAAPSLFEITGHPPAMQSAEIAYFAASAYGAGAVVCATALAAYFGGRGKTKTLMVVDAIAALSNVVLDYAWVFGHFGLPAAGIEGAAYATNFANWLRAAIYLGLILGGSQAEELGVWRGLNWSTDRMRRLLYYGGPEGLRLLVDVAAYTGFLILVGRLGDTAAFASSLAFSVNNFVYVPILGLGGAVSTLVGQRIGAGEPWIARRVTHTALWMGLLFCGVTGLVFWFAPEWVLAPFMRHASRSPELLATTAMLLKFVAAYCLLDACHLVYQGAIRGAGDTRFILRMTLVMSSVPLAVIWYGLEVLGWGLVRCWSLLTLWVCAFGVAYMLRFYHGAWMKMSVIEGIEGANELK